MAYKVMTDKLENDVPPMGKYHGQYEYQTVQTFTKYFEDGRQELWLTNDEGDELYLIKSYQHPSGKSPIVEMTQPKASKRIGGE